MGSYCIKHNMKLKGLCLWCGKEVCSECVALAKGKKYCNDCISKIRIIGPDSDNVVVSSTPKQNPIQNTDDTLNIEIIN